MSRWRVIVMVLTALLAMPIAARADDYPTRNVTILVPFTPGGGTDHGLGDALAHAAVRNARGAELGPLGVRTRLPDHDD